MIKLPSQRLRGLYRVEVIDGVTGLTKTDTGFFDNLITNGGLDQLGEGTYKSGGSVGAHSFANNGSTGSRCHVGSGNSAPSVTNTALDTHVASTQTQYSWSQGNSGGSYVDGWFAYIRKTYQFDLGTFSDGTNLSELGISMALYGSTSLFSRALIVDGLGGAPTTIAVGEIDVLRITYECRCYPNFTDVTGSTSIGGFTYDYTIRPFGISNWATQNWSNSGNNNQTYSGSLLYAYADNGADLAAPNSNTVGGTAMSLSPGGQMDWGSSYSNGAYTNNLTQYVAESQFNHASEIRMITRSESSSLFHPIQIRFGRQGGGDEPIPKDETQTMFFDIQVSWSQYTP